MRVVVPTVRLHPAAARLLSRHAPGWERHTLANPDGYHHLVEWLWGQGKDFLLVEHDVGIHADVVPQLESCPSVWCAFRYPIESQTIAALGCTRFRSELLLAEPDLMHVVGEVDTDGLPARDWRRMDVRMMDELHRRGWRRCEHTPEVRHFHDYRRPA